MQFLLVSVAGQRETKFPVGLSDTTTLWYLNLVIAVRNSYKLFNIKLTASLSPSAKFRMLLYSAIIEIIEGLGLGSETCLFLITSHRVR